MLLCSNDNIFTNGKTEISWDKFQKWIGNGWDIAELASPEMNFRRYHEVVYNEISSSFNVLKKACTTSGFRNSGP